VKSISLLSVSLLNEDLISNLIKSCEKFKPKDLTINYIVVENSNETSYRDRICSLAPNVTWVQNPIQDRISSGAGANHGAGLNLGMKYVNDDWVLICDSDTFIVSSNYFNELFKKVDCGYSLIGMRRDNTGLAAIAASGLFVKSDIARIVDLRKTEELDTAHALTKYVNEHDLECCSFRNTWADPSLVEIINEPYNSWGESGIDRCLDSNDGVMQLHLGRGTSKYSDLHVGSRNRIFDGKVGYDRWLDFCEGILND